MAWSKKSKAVRPRGAKPVTPTGWPGVRLAAELLEDRALPRPTLYVDFGDGFTGGVLTRESGP